MRIKKRQTNIKLLARGLENLTTQSTPNDDSEQAPIETKKVRFTNEKPAVIYDSKPNVPKTSLKRRGPKIDALIDTTKLLSI